MNRIQRQRGIGLIELMVALVISLFLMIGLGTVYYGMRQTSSARSGLSQLQDQQRTAMTLLGNAVQQAGFFPTPLTNISSDIFLANQTPFTVAGTAITGTSSTFSVRYRTDAASPLATCTGLSTTSSTYIDTYSISTDGTNTLNCVETKDGVTSTTQSMVSGISSMTVLFGVDTNSDGSSYQYQAAAAVTTWDLVKSVKVTLYFVNPMKGQAGQADTIPFTRTIGLMNTL